MGARCARRDYRAIPQSPRLTINTAASSRAQHLHHGTRQTRARAASEKATITGPSTTASLPRRRSEQADLQWAYRIRHSIRLDRSTPDRAPSARRRYSPSPAASSVNLNDSIDGRRITRPSSNGSDEPFCLLWRTAVNAHPAAHAPGSSETNSVFVWICCSFTPRVFSPRLHSDCNGFRLLASQAKVPVPYLRR